VSLDLTLGVRWDFPAGMTPGSYFVCYWEAKGVVYEQLNEEEQHSYDEALASYVAVCTKLMADREKQAQLGKLDDEAYAWAQAQTRMGRPPWGVRVPVGTAPATRAREGEGRGGRRGGAAGTTVSRDGPDSDPEPPSDLTRLQRRVIRSARGGPPW
jgi:hypothetical protein